MSRPKTHRLGGRIRAYSSGAAWKRGYRAEKELARVTAEVIRTLGELERSHPGLQGRIELALDPEDAEAQARYPDDMRLLVMAVNSVIGSGPDCRPMTEAKETELRRYHDGRPEPMSPEEEFDQGMFEAWFTLAMADALDGLSPRECEILIARFFPGLTIKEAARRLSMAPTTYHKRLQHILSKIAHHFVRDN